MRFILSHILHIFTNNYISDMFTMKNRFSLLPLFVLKFTPVAQVIQCLNITISGMRRQILSFPSIESTDLNSN